MSQTVTEPEVDGTESAGEEKNPLAAAIEEYCEKENLPLPQYGGLMALYGFALGSFLIGVKAKRGSLPEKIEGRDLLLLGVASHKLSRLLSKGLVTSPIRAPFARLEEMTGAGQVKDTPRGEGLQRAIGELLTCPFCLGTWTSTALVCAFVLQPKTTRFVASILSTSALSDYLQFIYTIAKEKAEDA